MTKEASELKLIRFIDSDYNDLFFLPDGANIRLTYANGEERILSCKYMDEYHLKAGSEVFHICQFAELMDGAKRNSIPARDAAATTRALSRPTS